MGDLTLLEALTGGAFDRLNWQHSGEFDRKFSKKSNARGFAGGAWAVLELTGTLTTIPPCSWLRDHPKYELHIIFSILQYMTST